MPTATIDQLPSGAPLSGSDLFESLQVSAGQNVSVRVSATQLKNFVQSSAQIYALELVQEYNLSSEGLSASILWDGETYDYLRIESSGDFDFCLVRYNNDSGNNYQEGRVTQDGNTPGAGASLRSGAVFTQSTGQHQFTIFEANLKNNGYRRLSRATGQRWVSGNDDQVLISRACYWTNTANNITSITLVDSSSGLGSNTGIIRVFRRARIRVLI